MHAISGGLILDMDDIGLPILHNSVQFRPDIPAPAFDLGKDLDAWFHPAFGGVDRGQNPDIVAQFDQGPAQLPRVIGHATLHGRVFAGDEEDAEGFVLMPDSLLNTDTRIAI